MNTKQAVCGIFAVLLLTGAGAVFAQEKKPEAGESAEPAAPGIRKNAITLDAMSLFRGLVAIDGDTDTGFFCIALAYERLVAPHFTFGAELDLFPGKVSDIDYVYFGLAAAGRFYPMSEYMEKFFIGANLGFNVQAIDGEPDAEHGGFAGLTIGLKAGYKLLFTEMFFMEPSLSYTYSKSSSKFFGSTPQNLGWAGGLRVGVLF